MCLSCDAVTQATLLALQPRLDSGDNRTCLMISLPAVAICGCMLSMMAARPAGGSPENSMLSLMAVSEGAQQHTQKEDEAGSSSWFEYGRCCPTCSTGCTCSESTKNLWRVAVLKCHAVCSVTHRIDGKHGQPLAGVAAALALPQKRN